MGNTCGAPQRGAVQDEKCDGPMNCHSKPRLFPHKGDGATSHGGGECLLFLENARSVPYGDPVRDLTCHAVSSRSHGYPTVRAWAETEDGELVGRQAQWPAKHCNQAPSWYSARPLGFSLVGQSAAGAWLQLELRDGDMLLGRLRMPLKDIKPHVPTTQNLDMEVTSADYCTITFQLLDFQYVSGTRKVYFIRHGESVWNKAQSELDLHSMASDVDHPLSEAGCRQAEELGAKLARAKQQSNDPGAALARPDVVYVSPLTRAFQTAVIGLGPLLTQQAEAEQRTTDFVVMANAREKQTLGGFDTWSTEVGEDVPRRVQSQLRAHYEGRDDRGVLRAFSRIHVDAQEVEDCWWVDGAETPAQLTERLKEFMSQLLFSPHETIVVVGHSLFFREVLRRFLSDDFKTSEPDFCRKACSAKIMNCGVVLLGLDPRFDLDNGPIVSAQLVLDSKFEEHGGGMLACCAAPTNLNEFAEEMEEAATTSSDSIGPHRDEQPDSPAWQPVPNAPSPPF